MKIEKKTLAREIIILLSTLGLILLFFVGTEIYNWIFNVKIDNRDKSISAINSEISLNNHLIDSLKYSGDPFNGEEPPPSRYLWVKMQRDGYDATYDRFREVFSDATKRDELYSDLVERKQYTKSKSDFMNQYFTDIPLKNKGTASSPTSIEEPIKDLWQLVHTQIKGFNVDFESFKFDMKDATKQERLYTTLATKGDYKGSLSDFRSTYFKPTASLPTSIVVEPLAILWESIKARNPNFTVGFDKFKSDMNDPSNQKRLHQSERTKAGYTGSFDDFHAQYFSKLLPPSINSDTPDSARAAQIKTYTDIKDNKQKEKSKLEEERDNYKRTQLGAEGGKRMTLNFALILFTLVYVLRGLIFTLKWSIKTLKEE